MSLNQCDLVGRCHYQYGHDGRCSFQDQRRIVAFGVTFKRTQNGPWEDGVYVGRSDTDGEKGKIFDFNGDIINELWDYRDKHYTGSAIFREDD